MPRRRTIPATRRGGRRPGAGRKPAGLSPLTIRLDDAARLSLVELGEIYGLSLAEVVRRLALAARDALARNREESADLHDCFDLRLRSGPE